MNRLAVRRPTLWIVRVVALLHAGTVCSQPVLAGLYLGGETGALTAHEANAGAIIGWALLQFVATLLHSLVGRGPIWPAGFSLAMFAAETTQWTVGYDHALHIHLPLGVSIVTSQVVFTIWSFRSGSRRGRTWRLPWERATTDEPATVDVVTGR